MSFHPMTSTFFFSIIFGLGVSSPTLSCPPKPPPCQLKPLAYAVPVITGIINRHRTHRVATGTLDPLARLFLMGNPSFSFVNGLRREAHRAVVGLWDAYLLFPGFL